MYFTINKDKTKLYELEFYRRRFNIFIDMCNYHLWLIMSDFESYLIDYKITKNLVVYVDDFLPVITVDLGNNEL